MSKKRLTQTKKNIVFLGHMGSGKSTIGRGLSKKLGLDFYDTDKEIEKEMGQKIAKIFDVSGESIFRTIERKINLKLLDKKNSIIALGGGGFEDLKIRKLILNKCNSIWLKCDLNILEKRCRVSKKRPLLSNKNIKAEFERLNKIRQKNYSKAKFTIDVSKKNKYQIIKEITEALKI